MRLVVVFVPLCAAFAPPQPFVVKPRPETSVRAIDLVEVAVGGTVLVGAAAAAFFATKLKSPAAADAAAPKKAAAAPKKAAPPPPAAPVPVVEPIVVVDPLAAAIAKVSIACWSGDAYQAMKWKDTLPRQRVAVDPRGQRAAWSGSPYATPARKSVPTKAKDPPVDAALKAKVAAIMPSIARAPAPAFERAAWSGSCFAVPTRASLPAPPKRKGLFSRLRDRLFPTNKVVVVAASSPPKPPQTAAPRPAQTNAPILSVKDWRAKCDGAVVSYADLGVRWKIATNADWRSACDAAGVTSFYDFGVRL
mmetsp:Transcript_25388/g.82123  ORF Transcript_25388/g.82123 Transcript_25388/m.82123 type:complete len:306 (+) Transcript_25388:56-973(+)